MGVTREGAGAEEIALAFEFGCLCTGECSHEKALVEVIRAASSAATEKERERCRDIAADHRARSANYSVIWGAFNELVKDIVRGDEQEGAPRETINNKEGKSTP